MDDFEIIGQIDEIETIAVRVLSATLPVCGRVMDKVVA